MKCNQCGGEYLSWYKFREFNTNNYHTTIWEITCMMCHARACYKETVEKISRQTNMKQIGSDYYE